VKKKFRDPGSLEDFLVPVDDGKLSAGLFSHILESGYI
jgi:hypothetical protein